MTNRNTKAADLTRGMRLVNAVYRNESTPITGVRLTGAGLYVAVDLDDGTTKSYRTHAVVEVAS